MRMANETTGTYLNESSLSSNSSDSTILFSTISSYDTTINGDDDYGDLYEEDTIIFDNVTLASSNEHFELDWGLFYTGMSNKDYGGSSIR